MGTSANPISSSSLVRASEMRCRMTASRPLISRHPATSLDIDHEAIASPDAAYHPHEVVPEAPGEVIRTSVALLPPRAPFGIQTGHALPVVLALALHVSHAALSRFISSQRSRSRSRNLSSRPTL